MKVTCNGCAAAVFRAEVLPRFTRTIPHQNSDVLLHPSVQQQLRTNKGQINKKEIPKSTYLLPGRQHQKASRPNHPPEHNMSKSIPLPAKEEIKAELEATKKASMSGLRSLVAGGVGGICAVLSGMSP